ncbi:MAG TPA: winged helix DNA-binding domain-containing protein [Mycobacteriales bacterium]|jgi:hypothetical protein|nr:winged helix DNA-binding domain-containing protein [Mycobacteriales bacterium]
MTDQPIGARALNRALLDRQLLLRRVTLAVPEVVAQLVGLQAQAPNPPYFGLWSRLVGFTPDRLSRLIEDRTLVRIVLMRGTIHLVTAADALTLRPLIQPLLERDLVTNATYGRDHLAGVDLPKVAEVGRQLLTEEPRTMAQLRGLLAERWPDRAPGALAHAVRALLPLVQLPPRGIWGRSGQPVCTTAEHWLGRPLDPAPSLERMVLRYLAAFGPATVRDVQAWSGLTRLSEITDRLGGRLIRLRAESGPTLFDLPDAPRPGPDVAAPVRFLAPFDNVLLSHADRGRIIGEAHRHRVVGIVNGIIPGTVLVDGFVRGIWKIAESRSTATVSIEPFRPLSKRHAAAVIGEAARLLRFAAPGVAPDVRIVDPSEPG